MKPVLACTRIGLGLAVLLLAAGCRNPFDPEADVSLVRFYATDAARSYVETIIQSTATSRIDTGISEHMITAQLYNYSSVGARFHSYTLVYRQVGAQTGVVPNLPPGQPIAALGGAAGRRYLGDYYIRGLQNNYSEFMDRQIPMIMLTEELFTYIGNNADTTNGGIDIDVSLFGVDENDHDIVIHGTFHIEVF